MIAMAVFLVTLILQVPATRTLSSVQGIVCEIGQCKPIRGVQISLVATSSDDIIRTAISDQTGAFSLFQIPAGKYRIEASEDEFTLVNGPVSITVVEGESLEGLRLAMIPP